MRKLFATLAICAVCLTSASAQLVLKAGNDGKVYEPQPFKATGTELTTPQITGAITGTFSLPSTATVPSSTVSSTVTTATADGAIPLTNGVYVISKAGSASATTIAAPGVAGIRITITTGTDFAHVVTFTGATLWDGTATANSTWTAAAVQGSSLTVVSVSATKWNVESFNLGTIAP